MKFLLSRDVSCDGNYAELKVAIHLTYVVKLCTQFWQVSPLLLATLQGHIKVVKILLDHPRINVTLTNAAGYNALAEAIVKGYRQVITVLKESMHIIYTFYIVI